MKTCPFCAESIQDAAVKCRYCGSSLAVAAASPPVAPPSSDRFKDFVDKGGARGSSEPDAIGDGQKFGPRVVSSPEPSTHAGLAKGIERVEALIQSGHRIESRLGFLGMRRPDGRGVNPMWPVFNPPFGFSWLAFLLPFVAFARIRNMRPVFAVVAMWLALDFLMEGVFGMNSPGNGATFVLWYIMATSYFLYAHQAARAGVEFRTLKASIAVGVPATLAMMNRTEFLGGPIP